MKLIVNGTAVERTSLGGRRYYDGIVKALRWPGAIEQSSRPRWARLERPSELLQRGSRDAIFWSPSQRGPFFARHHVVTVLDCINVEYIYRSDWRLPVLRAITNAVLRNAEAIVAISHATRDAVLRNYAVDAAKVLVIPGPVDFRSDVTGPPPQTQPPADGSRFVLMICNALPHKNTALAARAFAASEAAARGISLRVVGSIEAAGLVACEAAGAKVELRKDVSDAELSGWLASAEFLLSPSLDEGLNLPIAEALTQGGRVLCSDIPVHREFYDGQVHFFDPLRFDGIILALNEAFARQPGAWPARHAPIGPSFDNVASQYRALFERIASANGSSTSF